VVDTLTTNLATLDGKVVVVDNEIATLDGKVVIVDGKVDTIDSEVGTIDGLVDTLTTNLATLDGKVVVVDNEIATLDGKVVTLDAVADLIKTDTTNIEADTQNIQSRLPAALVAGRMSSDAVAISGVTAAADGVEANIANLDATVSTRATPAQVNTEVVDALTIDTHAELGAAPAATSSILGKLTWLFMLAKNKRTETATLSTLRNDADSGDVSTAVTSDDTVTFTRAEWS